MLPNQPCAMLIRFCSQPTGPSDNIRNAFGSGIPRIESRIFHLTFDSDDPLNLKIGFPMYIDDAKWFSSDSPPSSWPRTFLANPRGEDCRICTEGRFGLPIPE